VSTSGRHASAQGITAVPGLVLLSMGSVFYAVNAATGQLLYSYQNPDFHWFFSPPITAYCANQPPTCTNGTVYIGNSDGNLFAFAPTSP
jgi:outer membrane protein assembly factor BamB